MSIRQEKFSKLVQKELADIFTRNRSSLFENAFITVSNVTVSPDLSYAKVYLSFFDMPDKQGKKIAKEELLSMISLQTKVIRHELAQKIRKQARIVPELQFFIDDSLDYVFHMENVFKNIHKKEDGE